MGGNGENLCSASYDSFVALQNLHWTLLDLLIFDVHDFVEEIKGGPCFMAR